MVGLALLGATLHAQQHGVVVDQTGLPLPGARIDLRRGEQILSTVYTALDGAFDLPDAQPTDRIDVSLDGFETAHIEGAAAQRIVLSLAHATMTTEVVASTLTSSGAAMEHLGSTMTAPLAQRLPTPRPRILQSLPLLPAVVRGRDGLLRIGGTRPHESTLWIDGFDVTDPVSGTTALDLPNESVKGMAVLREPVSAEFRDVLGSAASIQTTAGTDQWKGGVQGFIPRPRISHIGPGRIESFFPRAYVGGRIGIVRVFASTEFNFERVPVAGVTGDSGNPTIGTTGVTSFVRFDLQPSTRHSITVDGLYAPAKTTSAALSSLRPEGTAPDVDVSDVFGGVTDRLILGTHDLLTLRLGVIGHHTALTPTGSGTPLLTPEGWRQNWFSTLDVDGRRASFSASWEHDGIERLGTHSLSMNGSARYRSMDGTLVDAPIRIVDENGEIVRAVFFGPTGILDTADMAYGAGFRDLWDVTSRLQIDLGLRLDGGGASETVVPGPRVGVRYLLDADGRTIVRGSIGRYVGRVPLGAKAFNGFPSRLDVIYDLDTHQPISRVAYRPAVGDLPLPRADAVSIEIEHHFTSTLEVQAATRARDGSLLPTVNVPDASGRAWLMGAGESRYRELQLSVRKTWPNLSQVFVSYVWSSTIGQVNDFGTLFTNLDAPLIEPAGQAPTPADVPHRLRAWSTFSLPLRIVVSPAVDWRTGFPWSALTIYQHYAEPPNSERYPAYFSADLTAFKTFDFLRHEMDLGLQFFNLTGHANPRDVVQVVDSPNFRQYADTFGVTLAGYMQIRW
ncbi:MAG TPA: carboxypeptidase-like regulatory domain-containing protein [Vicinamibacterales bacterium]|nr:carboxypeptidase-like regulatory domain-containing protein [Vicinamibacterales bacterium]